MTDCAAAAPMVAWLRGSIIGFCVYRLPLSEFSENLFAYCAMFAIATRESDASWALYTTHISNVLQRSFCCLISSIWHFCEVLRRSFDFVLRHPLGWLYC